MTHQSVSPSSRVSLWTPPFLNLVMAHLLQATGYASMMLLPLYLDHLQASRSQIGAVMAAASVGSLLIRPFIGWALDHLGRRPVIAGATAIIACGIAALGFVQQVGVLVYVLRFAIGIGIGILFAGYFTVAADVIPAARRTEGLALFGISGLLPLMLNPLAARGGIKAHLIGGYLPLVSFLVVASLLFFFALPRESGTAAHTPQRHPAEPGRMEGGLYSLIVHPGTRSIWLAAFAVSAVISTFGAFAAVIARQRGIGEPTAFWYTFAGGAALVRLSAGRLFDRYGPARFVPVAFTFFVAGCVLAGVAYTTLVLVLAGFLIGIGHGIAFPVLVAVLVGRIPAHLKGTGMAVFTGFFELSALLCPPLFGVVADRAGDGFLYVGLAGMLGAALFGWLGLERNRAPS